MWNLGFISSIAVHILKFFNFLLVTSPGREFQLSEYIFKYTISFNSLTFLSVNVALQ